MYFILTVSVAVRGLVGCGLGVASQSSGNGMGTHCWVVWVSDRRSNQFKCKHGKSSSMSGAGNRGGDLRLRSSPAKSKSGVLWADRQDFRIRSPPCKLRAPPEFTYITSDPRPTTTDSSLNQTQWLTLTT